MSMTLKALRINLGLTQKDAAAKLQVTPETLGSWERAETFPNVTQITRIENLYNTTYADINFLPANIGLTDD